MLPLSDKLIYIVGPLKLQNELMATFLEQTTGADCKVLRALNEMPRGVTEDNDQPRLALCDCLGKDLRACLKELESNGDGLSDEDYVCLFNVHPEGRIEERTLAWGARGFFYEHDSLEHFARGATAVFKGELWISRRLLTDFILSSSKNGFSPKAENTKITEREKQILGLIASGLKNHDIAQRLCISRHTVKTHLYNIFKKIGVPNRLQAALWAAKNL